MPRRKVGYEGREVEAEDIGFRVIEDGAMTLELDDAAQLRIRPIIINVLRTDEKTPEGERLYIVQSVVSVLIKEPADEDRVERKR